MLTGAIGWFKTLSLAGKTGVVVSSVVVGGTGLAAVSPEPAPTAPPVECTSSTSQQVETESIYYKNKEIKDPTLDKGKSEIRAAGANGQKRLTYEVTEYSPEDCSETTRKLVKEKVVKKPVTKVTALGTYVAPVTPPPPPEPPAPRPAPRTNCDPNYSRCVPIASDVDCAGGSGNGPAYTGTVRVIGSDIYGLDADGDGYGCE